MIENNFFEKFFFEQTFNPIALYKICLLYTSIPMKSGPVIRRACRYSQIACATAAMWSSLKLSLSDEPRCPEAVSYTHLRVNKGPPFFVRPNGARRPAGCLFRRGDVRCVENIVYFVRGSTSFSKNEATSCGLTEKNLSSTVTQTPSWQRPMQNTPPRLIRSLSCLLYTSILGKVEYFPPLVEDFAARGTVAGQQAEQRHYYRAFAAARFADEAAEGVVGEREGDVYKRQV